jgi:hypothetical protein
MDKAQAGGDAPARENAGVADQLISATDVAAQFAMHPTTEGVTGLGARPARQAAGHDRLPPGGPRPARQRHRP